MGLLLTVSPHRVGWSSHASFSHQLPAIRQVSAGVEEEQLHRPSVEFTLLTLRPFDETRDSTHNEAQRAEETSRDIRLMEGARHSTCPRHPLS